MLGLKIWIYERKKARARVHIARKKSPWLTLGAKDDYLDFIYAIADATSG